MPAIRGPVTPGVPSTSPYSVPGRDVGIDGGSKNNNSTGLTSLAEANGESSSSTPPRAGLPKGPDTQAALQQQMQAYMEQFMSNSFSKHKEQMQATMDKLTGKETDEDDDDDEEPVL